jgi:molecular chaperone GrpE
MTDQRRPGIRRPRAQERIEELDTSPAGIAAAFEKLRSDGEAKVARAEAQAAEALASLDADRAKAEAERDEFLAALQRERAEFTNFRQRTAKEREMERGLAGLDLITKVLALADDFDRAIDSRPDALAESPWAEGIANIDRKLRGLLESEGVTAVEAKPGTDFDPRWHEAIASVPGTGLPDGTIVEEVRRGYRLRDRLVRPALVAVAQGGDASPAARPN